MPSSFLIVFAAALIHGSASLRAAAAPSNAGSIDRGELHPLSPISWSRPRPSSSLASVDCTIGFDSHFHFGGDRVVPEMSQLADGLAMTRRAKVRYGPFGLPGAVHDAPARSSGSADRLIHPCPGDCVLLSAQVGVEQWQDGVIEDRDTELQSLVASVQGPGRADLTCPQLPGERLFSSGNDRSTAMFFDRQHGNVLTGFPLGGNDTIRLDFTLINRVPHSRCVIISIDYEYLAGPLPKSWKTTRAIWLDVDGCPDTRPSSAGSIDPVSQPAAGRSSAPWQLPWDAYLFSATSFLGEGVTALRTYQGDSLLCDARGARNAQASATVPCLPRSSALYGPSFGWDSLWNMSMYAKAEYDPTMPAANSARAEDRPAGMTILYVAAGYDGFMALTSDVDGAKPGLMSDWYRHAGTFWPERPGA